MMGRLSDLVAGVGMGIKLHIIKRKSDWRRVCLGVIEEEMESESSNHHALSLCWWFVMAARRCNAIYTIDAIGLDDW